MKEETDGRRKMGDKWYWKSLPKSLACRMLPFSQILSINSPPSSFPCMPHSQASSWSSCSYEPIGFRGTGSQGIIIFHSTKAVKWYECQLHAGSKRRCIIMNTEPKMIPQRLCKSGRIGNLFSKQLINQSSLAPLFHGLTDGSVGFSRVSMFEKVMHSLMTGILKTWV